MATEMPIAIDLELAIWFDFDGRLLNYLQSDQELENIFHYSFQLFWVSDHLSFKSSFIRPYAKDVEDANISGSFPLC